MFLLGVLTANANSLAGEALEKGWQDLNYHSVNERKNPEPARVPLWHPHCLCKFVSRGSVRKRKLTDCFVDERLLEKVSDIKHSKNT